MTLPIFISYASRDGAAVETLCEALENRGFPCWIAGRDIAPGENFQAAIVRAIRSAKVMILMLTANANHSEELKKELALAGQNRLTVIPVRLEDVAPDEAFAYELATRQWIDFFAGYERALDRLVRHLSTIEGLGARSAPSAEPEIEQPGQSKRTSIAQSSAPPVDEHATVEADRPAEPNLELRQIGYLGVSMRPVIDDFRRGLAAHGLVDGDTIRMHFRWSSGDYTLYPELLRQLIEVPVELIVADATPAVAAAKAATTTIPNVMTGVGDPIAYGIVPSLMRPGGNITGISGGLYDYLPRTLRLFKEIQPDASRVAILAPASANHVGVGPAVKTLQDAALALDMMPRVYYANTPDELRYAVTQVGRSADVLTVIPDHGFSLRRSFIIEGANKAGVPVVCPSPEYVPDGALMSLGPNRNETHRRLAHFVDAILKGTRPRDLPIEEPAKPWLVINLKTAGTLGIIIPTPILMRADQLIE